MKNKYQNILGRIKAARRRETTFFAIDGVVNAVFVAAISILLFTFIEYMAQGDTSFRSLLAMCILGATSLAFLYFTRTAIGRALGFKIAPSVDDIALRIGKKFPQIGDRLCNNIQIYRTKGTNTIFSEELTEASFDNVYDEVKDLEFNRIVSRKPIFYSSIRAGIAVLLLLAVLFFSNSMSASFERIVNYDKSYIPPAPYSLEIFEADSTVLRGENVILKIKGKGDAPSKIRMKIRLENQTNYDTYELESDTNNIYSYEIKSIKRSIEYYAESDWLHQVVESPKQDLRVIHLPLVRSLNGTVRMPAYTKLASIKIDENDANINALRGSTVDFNVFANKELEKSKVVMIWEKEKSDSVIADTNYIPKYDTLNIKMSVSDRKANGRFFVMRTGTYHVELTDKDGQVNQTPIKYSINCLDDAFPLIAQTEPLSDKSINQTGLLPIYVNINDDYGFKYLRLYYRLAASKYAPPQEKFDFVEIPINPTQLYSEVMYVWDLMDLGITPEDVFQYYLEVADNDVIKGPKTAKTSPLLVRLPSFEELSNESDQTMKELEEEMQEALKEAKELEEEMKQFSRELLPKKNKEKLNWTEQKKAEELMNRQKQLKEKMDRLADKMEKNTDKMRENNMMSQETLERFMELQKLMKEVDSDELRKMQEKMKKAMENMTAEEMKEAMKKYEFNEEQFKKQIERTMELLKKMKAEQKADALSKRAKQLAEQQKKLAEETAKLDKKNKEAIEAAKQKQENLKKDFENFIEDFKDWEKMMEELQKGSYPEEMFQETKDALKEENTKNEMSEAQENMENSQMQDAQNNQENAAQNMQNLSDMMSKMRKEMQKNAKEEAKKTMQKAMSDMQELSEKQENLMNKTDQAGYNSTKLPDYAKEQAEIFEQMTNVVHAMNELAKKSMAVTQKMATEMAKSMEAMSQAVDRMADGNSSRAGYQQQEAMAGMNSALGEMQSQMNAMNQPNSGSCSNPGGDGQGQGQGMGMGMGQQMQQMAAQQQHINQALQQMMQQGGKSGKGGNGGGQGMSPQQQAEAKKLGGQMGKAGKSMQELANEEKKFGNSERKAGEMKKLGEEMEKIAKEISQGNITPETLKRQEQILNKMLDITKSVNDRDFEKKREAKSGKDYKLISPEELDLMSEEGKKQAYKELMKNNKQGYSKDYQELIRRYFEALQDQPTDEK